MDDTGQQIDMEYIYLHGFLSGPNSAKGQFLSRKFGGINLSLHRPDLNGGDFEQMTITSQLEIIDRLISSLTGDLILIGSSLGGFLAALTSMRCERVKGLILMAPAFDFVNRYFDRLTAEQLHIWKTTGSIKLYHYHHQEHRKLSYRMVEDAGQYRAVRLECRVPTRIFHGIHDQSVPYQVSLDFVKAHPTTTLILLNSDHGLLDKLEEIWGYMRPFLHI